MTQQQSSPQERFQKDLHTHLTGSQRNGEIRKSSVVCLQRLLTFIIEDGRKEITTQRAPLVIETRSEFWDQ
jgi:hypothetical protein